MQDLNLDSGSIEALGPVGIPMMLIGSDGSVVSINDAAGNLFPDKMQLEILARNFTGANSSRLNVQFFDQQMSTISGQRWMRLSVGATSCGRPVVSFVDIDDLKRSIAELRSLVQTDELTKVASRRRFFDEGERMLADHRRHGTGLAVALVDLDGFKLVNDRCGHSIGDHVLVVIAELITRSVRRNDLVARIGGDEFAILMPFTGLEEAGLVLRRLVENVRSELEKLPPARVFPSLSAGVAAVSDDSTTLQSMLENADAALYRAKTDKTAKVAVAS